MVKVGPRLPPPTRRELARLEKEQKRAEQLENGNLAVLGEPRERVIYLFRVKKAAHHPRVDDHDLEEARRKREKNHRRALARKLAKASVEKDVGQGSMDCADLSSDAIDLVFEAVRTVHLVQASPACLPESSGHFDEISARSLGSPGGKILLDILANGIDGSLSSLSPTLEPGSESEGNFDLLTISVSVPCPDSQFLDLSNPLASSGPGRLTAEPLSMTVAQGDLHSKTDRTIVQTPKTFLHPNSAVRSSLLVFPNKSVQELPVAKSKFSRWSSSTASVNNSARTSSSKPVIFSEPLDISKYSLKPPPARSSSRSPRSPPILPISFQKGIPDEYAAKAPVIHNQLFKFIEPSSSSASKLAAASNIRVLPGPATQPVLQSSKTEPLCPTISKGTEDLPVGFSVFTDKPQYVGLSGQPLFTHFSDVYETRSEKALLALSQRIKSSDRLSDGIELMRGVNLRHSRVNYPRASLEPVEGDKTPSTTQPKFGAGSSIGTPLLGRKDVGPGDYSKEGENFSSNKSNILRMEDKMESLAISAEMNTTEFHNDKSGVIAHNVSTVPTLEPAAPIIQERRPIFDDKFYQQRRGLTADDLERGMDPQTPLHFPRPTGRLQQESSLKYPDSPVDARSGIIPPASTPASRSPLLFAIALPSPPWSRATILPTHTGDGRVNTGDGGFGGLVLALKWVFKKTWKYFWQRGD